MLHPIAIFDKNNHVISGLSDPEDATNRGLWHRGAHVIIFTPAGRVLVQKRSLAAIQHAGMIDIGVGGFVDNDETPEQTAVRETFEETGLVITLDQLIFLGLTKYNHHWRFRKRPKISRSIIYTYVVQLPTEENPTSAQLSEVEWVRFIPLGTVKRLVTEKTLKNIGRLMPTFAYYRKVLHQAEIALRR